TRSGPNSELERRSYEQNKSSGTTKQPPPRVTVHSGGFWAAAAASGHHSGGTGPKRTVPSSSSHPDRSQPLHRPELAGIRRKPIGFHPIFRPSVLLRFSAKSFE
ncbi:AP2/B3-like transcriptional factor family protein, partial [Prunus dulcis]